MTVTQAIKLLGKYRDTTGHKSAGRDYQRQHRQRLARTLRVTTKTSTNPESQAHRPLQIIFRQLLRYSPNT